MNSKIRIFLFPLLFINLPIHLSAQDTIPNGSFENWSIIDSNEVPDKWQIISGEIAKDSAGYQSNYAIKLEVNQPGFETMSGLVTTGFPLNSIPSNLRGFVKCNVMPNDTVYIDFICYSGNTVVTSSRWLNTSSITTYTPFNISIDTGITAIDSAVITLTSGCCSSFGGASLGTELIVDELELDFYTGIKEKSEIGKKNEILIYPNPIVEAFTLSVRTKQSAVSNKLQIYIYDIWGELVYLSEITNLNSEIKISKLSKGIYFVKVINGHNQYVKKIIYQ